MPAQPLSLLLLKLTRLAAPLLLALLALTTALLGLSPQAVTPAQAAPLAPALTAGTNPPADARPPTRLRPALPLADPLPLLSETPLLTLTGEAPNADFGGSVASAGDVNGDGFADTLIGAPVGYNGRAYLYLGSAAGLSANPALTLTDETVGDSFGGSVASAGDVNDDGLADALVGADGYNNYQGRAYLYLGNTTGLSAIPALTLTGEAIYDEFGRSVASAGDVNGDGSSDALVGADGYNNAQGRAYLYLGNTTGLTATPALTLTGEAAGNYFGRSVASAGDVNDDGLADALVGAPGYNNYQGRAYLYLGNTTGLTATPTLTLTGEATDNYFGFSVASTGDVNGDGLADVLVGAYGYNGHQGRAYLYLGNTTGLTATPALTLTGEASYDEFGLSVASASDVNGDGLADALVGADGYNGFQGSAYLYLGNTTGLTATPALTLTGEAIDNHFGLSVASAGDVNGDGLAEALVGAYGYNSYQGRAYMYGRLPSPNLVVTKTIITDPEVAGTGSVYTITIVNQGVVTADNVTLSDTLSLSTTLAAVDQTDNEGYEFNQGTHSNTRWREHNHDEWLEMVSTPGSGQFTSRVFDAGYAGAWTELAWRPARPYGKPLPGDGAAETAYPLGNVNMTGNRALLRMNGDLTDSSGQGLDGTCTNCPGTGTLGQFGNAASFDGSDDEVMISDTVDPVRYALELWVNPTQIPITTSLIVRTDALSGTPYNYSHLLGIRGYNFIHMLDDGSEQVVVGSTDITAGQWYHLVGTAESGGDMKLYVNGAEEGQRREHLDSLWTGGDEYRLGASYGQTSTITTTHFMGLMDEVAVYTRTLAADEVMNHYLRGALRLSFEARSCVNPDCSGGSWSPAYTDQSGLAAPYPTATLTLPSNPYFQYRATFESDTSRYSPQVSWVEARPEHWLVTPSQGTCDLAEPTFTCGLGQIAPGGVVTVIVPVDIDPSALGIITNSVQVTSTNAVTRTAASTVTVVSHSYLEAEKFDEWEIRHDVGPDEVYDHDPVNPGSPITYSLQIYNDGPSTAWDVTFTDTMPVTITGLITPDGWSCVSTGQALTCTTTSLLRYDMQYFTVGGLAPDKVGFITNTIAITATGSTVTPTIALTDTETTEVKYLADLSIDKAANPDPVDPNTSFTYILTVTNHGPWVASNVAVTDTLPAGLTGSGAGCTSGNPVVCTAANLAIDDSVVFNLSVTAPVSGVITNRAVVSSDTYDPDEDNNEVILYTAIRRVTDLEISKTDDPDPVYTGEALTYTLTVTNTGPVEAGAMTTTVTALNPRALNFHLNNSRARPYNRDIWLNGINGVIREITVTVTISHTYPADMALLLVGPDGRNAILMANAGGGTDFGGRLSFNDNAPNLPLSDTITVGGVYKPTNHGFSDDLPEHAPAWPYGGSLSDFNGGDPNGRWELYAADTYPWSDTGWVDDWTLELIAVTTDTVTLTDTLPISLTNVNWDTPAGWNCGQSGNEITCESEYLGVNQPVTFTINATAPAVGGVITNTAGVTATTYDPNLITNTATITTLVLNGADLGIAKTVNTAAPQPGSLLTYTLVVTNSGPGDASGVVVSDTLPVSVTLVTSQTSQGQYNPATALWTVGGVISSGQRVTATLVVTVNAAAGQMLTNTAVISTLNQSDSITANNRAQVVVTVGSGADLGIVKTVTAPARAPGSTITYTIVVSNAGPDAATGVVVSDTLPGQVTFVTSTTTKGAYERTGGLWAVGDLAMNEVVTMTLVVTINLNASGNIVNTAIISAAAAVDPQPGNQSSAATITVSGGGGGGIYLPIIFKNFGPFIQPQ